jgi:outer membrane protein TolC
MSRSGLACLLTLAVTSTGSAQQPITLQQAIELALKQGYAARAALATRDAARYRDHVFYSRLLPQLSLGGTMPSYNHSIISVLQPDGTTLFKPQNQTNASLNATLSQKLPVLGGDFFVSSTLARLSVTGENSFHSWTSTPVSFGLRQDLLRPNASAWDQREQPLREELAERNYQEAREDIALTTSNLFFDLYSARVTLANQIKNAAINDTLYTLNKGRFEVGKIGENDLLQSELALLRARTSLDGARLEYDRAAAALRLALNLPAGAPVELDVSLTVPEFDADTAKAVGEALRNRASVSDVALQDVQARRRVTEARLSNWVGASVTASYGFNATAPNASEVYSNLLNAQQLAVSVSLPLWQWGAHSEGVQAAKADQERTTSLAQATLQQTAQDAYFAALQLSQARRNLALSLKADTVAGKRFEVALNRYIIGRIAIDNLYLAQSEKDQAVNQAVQSLRGYWQAYFRLRRMTLFDFEKGEPIR